MKATRAPAEEADCLQETGIASPVGGDTCSAIIQLGSQVAEILERLARQHTGVTLTQFRTMELLAANHPLQVEPWQIAEALGIGSNHVTMLLTQLESQALVVRHPHPSDGRRRLIEITPAGLEHTRELGQRSASLNERVLSSALTAEQRVEFDESLARVHAAILGLATGLRRRPGP